MHIYVELYCIAIIFRTRSPMSLQMGLSNRAAAPNSNTPVQSPQGSFFPQSRPPFSMVPTAPQNPGRAPFGNEQSFKGPGGMMFSRPPESNQGAPTSMQNSSPGDRFNSPHLVSAEGQTLPFGPNFASMFRHPPPGNRFPPPPHFQAPPLDHNLQSSQTASISADGHMTRPSGLVGANPYLSSPANFSHAPGTERPQGERGLMPPHLQMPFSQVNTKELLYIYTCIYICP